MLAKREQRGIKNKKPEITKLCISFKLFLQHAEPCPAIHFVPAIEAAGVKFHPFPLLDDASRLTVRPRAPIRFQLSKYKSTL